MLGVPDLVMAKVMTQFGHNYNFVAREVMYHWFNKYLKLGLTEPILEEDYERLPIERIDGLGRQPPQAARRRRLRTGLA